MLNTPRTSGSGSKGALLRPEQWETFKDIREVKQRVGRRMCLMGTVNPLEVAVRGTPAETRARTAAA